MIKKYLIVNSIVFLVVASTIYLFNRTFVHRIVSYPYANDITDASWYEPLATVAGNFRNPLPAADEAHTGISATARQKVIDYAAGKETAALLVMHNGQIIIETYWDGYHAGATSNSMSMAKTLLALLVGISIDEKKLQSEDDPVSLYLGEWTVDERARITIRQLLQMTTGLEKNAHLANPLSDVVQMYMNTDVNRVALAVPAEILPDTRFQYNNVNSQVLGILLQEIHGKPLAALLSEKIWQPIGARDAGYWLDRPEGNARAFCCFFARPRDWLRVGQLLLNQGRVGDTRVVSAEWIKKMLVPGPLEPDYGYHIWLNIKKDGIRRKHISEPFIAPDIYWLDGQDTQRVYVIPSYNLVIVRIGERPDIWDDALVPNTLIKDLKTGDGVTR